MSDKVKKVDNVEELLHYTHVVPDEEQLRKLIYKAALDFRGQIDDLFIAVGALYLGRLFGWRVLRLVFSSVNYAKYQRILSKGMESGESFSFNNWMREREILSYKSIGLELVDKIGGFWEAVKGRCSQLPIHTRREVDL
jgi:hypothetical protein